MVSVSVFCSQPRGNVILFTTPAKPWAKFDNFSTSTYWLTGFWTEGRDLKQTGYQRFPKHTRERFGATFRFISHAFSPNPLGHIGRRKIRTMRCKRGRSFTSTTTSGSSLRAWVVWCFFHARRWWQYICCPRHPVIPIVRRCEVGNP